MYEEGEEKLKKIKMQKNKIGERANQMLVDFFKIFKKTQFYPNTSVGIS